MATRITPQEAIKALRESRGMSASRWQRLWKRAAEQYDAFSLYRLIHQRPVRRSR